MPTPHPSIVDVLEPILVEALKPFGEIFTAPTWEKAQVLLAGVLLASGDRTVASALRAMGLEDDPGFSKYHQVLNRNVWSEAKMSRILTELLIEHFAKDLDTLILAIDDTLERRFGGRISALGTYRDGPRSTSSRVAVSTGLRWMSLMMVCHIPWAERH